MTQSSRGGSATRPASVRGIELTLLVFAAMLVTSALVLVEAEQNQQLSTQLLYLGAGYFGLFVGAHLVVRWTAPYADPLILPTVALLNGLGLVMIHRLDLAARSAGPGGPAPAESALRQLAWTALSVILLSVVLARIRDHRVIARYAYILGFGGLLLLLLPGVLPASISQVNGAKLWLRVGSLSIQPGEFAKIMIIAFAAAFLVSKRELFRNAGRRFLGMDFPRPRDLAPLLVAWGLSMGVLALERELGASLLIFGVILGMLYVATSRVSWMLVGLAIFAGSSVLAYHMFGHVRDRVQTWLDPSTEYAGAGYQVSQSLFGLGTGGMGGTGLGAGRPDLVPLANADFIAAAIGEELGLFGLAAVLVLYLVLVIRGLKTAIVCRDSFGTLLATGLSTTIALQVFIVVGGVTNLIPLTGLTTPFLSNGGSSLLANYILIALILRISDTAHRPAPAKPAIPRTPLAAATTQLVPNPSAMARKTPN
ncbi:MAG: FtsW/RodA/SpoVE family cell cycle protein [Pseudonocardia sp.]|nr:FtsW/RodA/SpoVE family cell cycle protein [Pseudonocardia sp.]